MSDLDNILSGQSDAVSEQAVNDEIVAAETGGENQQEQQQTDPDEVQATDVAGQKMVPHAALHASKEKVKRYTEEVADFRKSNETLQRQVTELLQRVPIPKVEQKQQPEPLDWFANPDAAFEQNLGRAINPIASTVSTIQTQLVRLAAVQEHGADKVKAFEAHIADAFAKGDPEMAALGAQMRASADPMKTGLDWFEKRSFDPAKEREKIEAEILAKHGLTKEGAATEQVQQAAPVMPSNFAGVRNAGSRSGPQWAGPTPLSDIFDRTRTA